MSQPVSLLRQHMQDAVEVIQLTTSIRPSIGIILGTGLGELAERIEQECAIPYENIPHFPIATVESHRGRLIFGHLRGRPVVAMQGRFHRYEGYTLQQVTFPVRVLYALGVRTLIISNAAGALNPLFRRGDLMIIVDHINLMGDNPLIGPNDDSLGPRFPDMSEPYSQRLIALAEEIALELRLKVQKGVYVALSGPSLETRAEYRFLRFIGADAVGMSTVPEVIVARHMGMEVFGLSILTDECFPDALQPLSLEDVLQAAREAEPKMTLLVSELVARLLDAAG
ncbi:MAG: purine-nucleoside phosphorylase [Candidatus Kapabacteria bacterium]|nr:purine-nucleoside phosphorylase [Candidatus Kapabacteria bacterium]MDW8011373.1 purine-nucleoside phosphorylase [Bacteroidota bacterium]